MDQKSPQTKEEKERQLAITIGICLSGAFVGVLIALIAASAILDISPAMIIYDLLH